jgi:hypothetical protein
LEVAVARFIVETKAVHGVERSPMWTFCIVAKPTVSAGCGLRVVSKVEIPGCGAVSR